jgi:hypothetical protein
MGYTLCDARPSRVKGVRPTWVLRPGTKQGSPHSPPARGSPADRWRLATGGGARELALEVRVPIWNIGSGEAHRGTLAHGKAGRWWGTGDGRPEKRWRAPAWGSQSGGELGRRSLRWRRSTSMAGRGARLKDGLHR